MCSRSGGASPDRSAASSPSSRCSCIGPLLFEHGLRDNAMEGPLFLCYCGGVYHYLAWASAGTPAAARARRRGHAVLRPRLHDEVRGQRLPADRPRGDDAQPSSRPCARRSPSGGCGRVLALARRRPHRAVVRLPVSHRGRRALPRHVRRARLRAVHRVARSGPPAARGASTTSTMFRQLGYSGTTWLAVVGGIVLLVHTVRQPSLDKLLVIYWFAIPVALISTGTSKLHHYLYPFLPPVALAAGYGPAMAPGRHASACRSGDGGGAIGGWIASRAVDAGGGPMRVLALAAIATVTGVADARARPHRRRRWPSVTVFRNSSVARPLVDRSRPRDARGTRRDGGSRLAAAAILLIALLPLGEYRNTIRELPQEQHPLRTAERVPRAACARASVAAGRHGAGNLRDRRRALVPAFVLLLPAQGRSLGRRRPADERTLEQALVRARAPAADHDWRRRIRSAQATPGRRRARRAGARTPRGVPADAGTIRGVRARLPGREACG